MTTQITAADAMPGESYTTARGMHVTHRGRASEDGYFALENENGAPMTVPGSYALIEIDPTDAEVTRLRALPISELAAELPGVSDNVLYALDGCGQMELLQVVGEEIDRREEQAATGHETTPSQVEAMKDTGHIGTKPHKQITFAPCVCPFCGATTPMEISTLGESPAAVFSAHPSTDHGGPCAGTGHTREAAIALAIKWGDTDTDTDPTMRIDLGTPKPPTEEEIDEAEAKKAKVAARAAKRVEDADAYAALSHDEKRRVLTSSVRDSRAALKLETSPRLIREAAVAEHFGKGRKTILKQLNARCVRLGSVPMDDEWLAMLQPGDVITIEKPSPFASTAVAVDDLDEPEEIDLADRMIEKHTTLTPYHPGHLVRVSYDSLYFTGRVIAASADAVLVEWREGGSKVQDRFGFATGHILSPITEEERGYRLDGLLVDDLGEGKWRRITVGSLDDDHGEETEDDQAVDLDELLDTITREVSYEIDDDTDESPENAPQDVETVTPPMVSASPVDAPVAQASDECGDDPSDAGSAVGASVSGKRGDDLIIDDFGDGDPLDLEKEFLDAAGGVCDDPVEWGDKTKVLFNDLAGAESGRGKRSDQTPVFDRTKLEAYWQGRADEAKLSAPADVATTQVALAELADVATTQVALAELAKALPSFTRLGIHIEITIKN